MSAARPGLVDIVREFLTAHALMRRLFRRHRAGELRFEELEALVGDDERSVLFRLKELCHAAFRAGNDRPPKHEEALFDLAVGSLFHEAMKFRENFYQREVYGPRVEALRSQAGDHEVDLFDEFTRIQQGVSARLEEGLAESEALLGQTLGPLLGLLAAHGEDPLVLRYLIGNQTIVEEALGQGLDALLARICRNTAVAYLAAGRSLLRSGYYPDAIRVLSAAVDRGSDRSRCDHLVSYARGMQAYLARDYAESVAALSHWADAPTADDAELSAPAHDALARVGQLAEGDDRESILRAASALLARLGERPAAPGSRSAGGGRPGS
jgi:hypothetical protein